MIGTVTSPGNGNFIYVFVSSKEISLLEKNTIEGDYKGIDGIKGTLKLSVDDSKCRLETAEFEYRFKQKNPKIIGGIDVFLRKRTYENLAERGVVGPHLGYAHIYIYDTSKIQGTRTEWLYNELKK